MEGLGLSHADIRLAIALEELIEKEYPAVELKKVRPATVPATVAEVQGDYVASKGLREKN